MALLKNQIIPPSGDVGGVVCFRVICPDSVLWRSAVKSAIRSLSMGRYWDGRSGVVLDAQQIATAIYDTASFHECGEGCECDLVGLETAMENIQNQIMLLKQEMKDMEVNFYNYGCGCNGGNSQTTSTTVGSDLPDINTGGDITIPPHPAGENQTDIDFGGWKCKASNHIVAKVRQLLVGLRNMIVSSTTTYQDISDYVQDVLGDINVGIRWGIAMFTMLNVYVMQYLSNDLYLGMVLWIDENAGDLANALFCGDSPYNSYQRVVALTSSSNLPTTSRGALRVLFLMPSMALLYEPVGSRIDLPDYAHVCSCGEPDIPDDLDFDVTLTLGVGNDYMEFITSHVSRSGVVDGYAFLNAMDSFPDVPLGLSHNGIKQIVADVLGGVPTSIQLKLFAFSGRGLGAGEWENGQDGTCTDGYNHSISGGDVVYESGIVVTCPFEEWYYANVDIPVVLTGDTGEAVGLEQHYLDTVPTNASQLNVYKLRIAGYAAVFSGGLG